MCVYIYACSYIQSDSELAANCRKTKAVTDQYGPSTTMADGHCGAIAASRCVTYSQMLKFTNHCEENSNHEHCTAVVLVFVVLKSMGDGGVRKLCHGCQILTLLSLF